MNVAALRHPRHDYLADVLPEHHHAVEGVHGPGVAAGEEAVEEVGGAAWGSESQSTGSWEGMVRTYRG